MIWVNKYSHFEVHPIFIGAYTDVSREIITLKGKIMEDRMDSPRYPIRINRMTMEVRVKRGKENGSKRARSSIGNNLV